jgi:Ulp1 family protease
MQLGGNPDLTQYELLLFPCHWGNHWALAVVDLAGGALHYYDSLAYANSEDAAETFGETLAKILRLVSDHSARVGGEEGRIDTAKWPIFYYTEADGVPQQNNTDDCGAFAVTYAAHIMAGAPFAFSVDDMRYFRQRLVVNIASAGRKGEQLPLGTVLAQY